MTFEPDRVVLAEAGAHAPSRWGMTTPLTWTGKFHGVEGRIEVPASPETPFETDLASVPRSLTWLLPRYGKYTKAAVLHDYLCQNFRSATAVAPSPPAPPEREAVYKKLEVKDRSDADEVFRQAMHELGVPWARRWVMWSAVNWATTATNLWPGRCSNPMLRWSGRIIALLALAAVVVFFATGAAGTLLGDSPDGTWLRVVGLAVGVFAAVATCALIAGYIAGGRWDRWFVDLAALGMTVASLPLLAVGVAVSVLLGLYFIIEELFSGFSSSRIWLGRWHAPETPRSKRLAEVRDS